MNHPLPAVRRESPASRVLRVETSGVGPPHEAPVSLLSGAAGAPPLLLLLAALWIVVVGCMGVWAWNAMVTDARTDVGAWGER